MLKSAPPDALRIAYLRGNGISFGKTAKFSGSRNVLSLSRLCFSVEREAAENAAVRYERFDRSI